jgi:PAS domain S-box-containing protein
MTSSKLSDGIVINLSGWPVPNHSSPAGSIPAKPEVPEAAPLTVLVADHDAALRETVERLLRDRYRVITATSGEQAHHAATRDTPDLILAGPELTLPDGRELLTALRSDPATQAIPIVILLPQPGAESRPNDREQLADDYLIQPFTQRELLARIRPHLTVAALRREILERERGQARQEQEQRQQAQRANALLSAIVQSSDDAIISKDLNAIITSWNRGAQQIFGYTAEEAIGQPVTLLMPPDRVNEEPGLLEQIRAGKRIEHYETVRRRKDGTLLDISLTISPLHDSNGRVVGASKIARDISDRKRVEATLLKAHGLGAAGRMAASIAHEINNPLEALSNLLYLMRTDVSGEEGVQNLATAEAQLARVAAITKKTLAYYRDTAEPEPVDLGATMQETLNAFVKKINDKQITVRCAEETCLVRGFKGEIQQLFSNLIANAIDAVGKGGTIGIEIQSSDVLALVTVQDNGTGISPELRSKLFEPFFTTKAQHMGTGLGLWICREIARKHGGEITLDSSTHAADHGTTFTVTLPRHQTFGA